MNNILDTWNQYPCQQDLNNHMNQYDQSQTNGYSNMNQGQGYNGIQGGDNMGQMNGMGKGSMVQQYQDWTQVNN